MTASICSYCLKFNPAGGNHEHCAALAVERRLQARERANNRMRATYVRKYQRPPIEYAQSPIRVEQAIFENTDGRYFFERLQA